LQLPAFYTSSRESLRIVPEAAVATWSLFCITISEADVIVGAKLGSAAVGPLQEPDADGQSQKGKTSHPKTSSSFCASPCGYSCFGILTGILDPAGSEQNPA